MDRARFGRGPTQGGPSKETRNQKDSRDVIAPPACTNRSFECRDHCSRVADSHSGTWSERTTVQLDSSVAFLSV